MAYGQQQGRSNYGQGKPATAPAAAPAFEKTEAVFITGVFEPKVKKEGSRTLGTIQLKEAVTLPANSILKVMAVDPSKYAKGKKVPAYLIIVNEGQPFVANKN